MQRQTVALQSMFQEQIDSMSQRLTATIQSVQPNEPLQQRIAVFESQFKQFSQEHQTSLLQLNQRVVQLQSAVSAAAAASSAASSAESASEQLSEEVDGLHSHIDDCTAQITTHLETQIQQLAQRVDDLVAAKRNASSLSSPIKASSSSNDISHDDTIELLLAQGLSLSHSFSLLLSLLQLMSSSASLQQDNPLTLYGIASAHALIDWFPSARRAISTRFFSSSQRKSSSPSLSISVIRCTTPRNFLFESNGSRIALSAFESSQPTLTSQIITRISSLSAIKFSEICSDTAPHILTIPIRHCTRTQSFCANRSCASVDVFRCLREGDLDVVFKFLSVSLSLPFTHLSSNK